MGDIIEGIITVSTSAAFLCLIIFVCISVAKDQARHYTIQDVELWCCNNVNASISPTGENCTELTKEMIGAYCPRMRGVR